MIFQQGLLTMKKLHLSDEDRKKILEIIDYYDGVVELLPEESEGYINRGFNYYLLRDYKKAEEDFNKVKEIEPENLVIRCILGFSRDINNECQEALDEFVNIIEADPNFAEAYVGLALIKINHGKTDEGIKYLDRAIELDPKNERAYIYRGELHFFREDYAKTIEDFEKAAALNITAKSKVSNKLAKAHFKLGLVYSDEKNYDKAIEHLSSSLSIDPVNLDAYLFRGEAYMNIENYAKAMKDLKKASALDPRGSVGKTAAKLLTIASRLA